MPVQKFRSVAEMNAAPVQAPPGSAFDRFLRHCARYRAISPTAYPRGVFKFRDAREALAARERAAGAALAESSDASSPRQ